MVVGAGTSRNFIVYKVSDILVDLFGFDLKSGEFFSCEFDFDIPFPTAGDENLEDTRSLVRNIGYK